MAERNSEFENRLNLCAVCLSRVAPPDQSGWHNFVRCHNCGTLLLFDSFGRLHYSAPDSLDAIIPFDESSLSNASSAIKILPESIARDNVAVPLSLRDSILIVGMVYPLIDVLERLRFILGRDVIAVKIDDAAFSKLIAAYGSRGPETAI